MKSTELSETVGRQIEKAAEVAAYLWERQWAERNGGNISMVLDAGALTLPDDLSAFRYVAVDGFPRESAGLICFVTGTGERLRDLVRPEQAGCVIRMDEQAAGYHILWGGQSGPDFRPTSELISHIKMHLDMISRGSEHRAVVHTHPIELIALSHHPEFGKESAKITRALWSMLPEVRAFVPKGIRVIPYALPGSEALADLTVEALAHCDVALWAKHGAIATGRDVVEAFDFIDVANKGAVIYLKCLAAGFVPEGMSDAEMEELARAFNL